MELKQISEEDAPILYELLKEREEIVNISHSNFQHLKIMLSLLNFIPTKNGILSKSMVIM